MRLISVKKYMLAGVAAMLLTGMVGCASNAGTTSTVADAIQEDNKSIETICEDLQSLSMDGVIYYQVNPVEYNEVSTANISFGQVTSIPDQDSKVKVTLPVTITMKGKYTNDCIDYSGCITPSFELLTDIQVWFSLLIQALATATITTAEPLRAGTSLWMLHIAVIIALICQAGMSAVIAVSVPAMKEI